MVLKNNSVIEHAKNGASAVRLYPNTDFSYTGGVIQATNSHFKNNQIAVRFHKFQNTNHLNGTNINNISYFTNCSFQTTQQLLLGVPNRFAWITETDGIRFNGCDFENTQPQLFSLSNWGFGIYVLNATLFVNAHCQIFPCNTNYDPSTFTNLRFGIYVINSNSLKPVTCNRSNFTNIHRSIYLAAANFSTVTENNFQIYKAALPNSIIDAYGLYLNNCTGYKVEANNFTDYNDINVSGPANTYGIIVNNSGVSDNEIYRNTFHNIKIGGQSQQINSSPLIYNPYPNNVGLGWKCNYFYDDVHQADLSYTSGRIAYQQGFWLNTTTPAGNRFSHNTFDPQNDFATNNNVAPLSYYHHSDINTTPQYYNSTVILPIDCQVIYNQNNIASCPSKINVLTKSEIYSLIVHLRNQINEKIQHIDGGNTLSLLNVVNSNINAGNLYNLLMQYSPYLSQEVLLAYIAKTGVPAGHLKNILIANSPLTPTVREAYSNLVLPPGIKNQIHSVQSGVSAMELLQNEINYLETERTFYVDDLIRVYLNDTVVINPIDTVIEILKEENRPDAKDLLCFAYQIKVDSASLEATKQQIIQERGYDNFCKIQEILWELRNAPSSCVPIKTDSTTKERVETIAYDPDDRKNCVNMEALLDMAFALSFAEIIEPLEPTGSGLRLSNQQSNIQQENIQFIKIYPNPANSKLFIELPSALNTNVVVQIYNQIGQEVYKTTFASDNISSIDVSKWQNGIYLLHISNSEEIIFLEKIVIQN
ncbi:MAG: T9SS type A sorting domain-containing protein [Bacteroidia bacterium]